MREITPGSFEMNAALEIQPIRGDRHIPVFITAAGKNPIFTSDLSTNWQWAWDGKRVEEWTSEDVMAWILHIIGEKEGMEIAESKAYNFNVKGIELMKMCEEQFIDKDPRYGGILYKHLQKKREEDKVRVLTLRCPSDFEYQGDLPHSVYSASLKITPSAAKKVPKFIDLSANWQWAWDGKRVEEWTSEDVMAWILYIIEEKEGMEIAESKAYNFNVKGIELLKMCKEQFIKKDPLYGEMLYYHLQKKREEDKKVSAPTLICLSDFEYPCNLLHSVYSASPKITPSAAKKIPNFLDSPVLRDTRWRSKPISSWSEQDVVAWINDVLERNELSTEAFSVIAFRCTGQKLLKMTERDFVDYHPIYGHILYGDFVTWKNKEDNSRGESDQSMDGIQGTPYESTRKSGSDSEDSTDELTEAAGEPRRKSGGHGRLWPFVRDLLKSGEHSDVIDWVNRDKGTFRVIDSKKFATLWGEARNNPNMTYEKMSRGLRYNYRTGNLVRVKGRRLVFGFGPNAKGWKMDEEIDQINGSAFPPNLTSFQTGSEFSLYKTVEDQEHSSLTYYNSL